MTSKRCRPESKLLKTPIRLSKTAWYYEEPQGICVIAESRDSRGVLAAVSQTIIPWHKLESSLKRRAGKP